MKKIYQVNLTEKVDGSREYWTSEWDADGYVGTTVDTVYSDGVDQTTWCLFTGTKEECEHWVSLQPELKMYEFHTINGHFEDGHADGYIWNVIYRKGTPTFLSEEEIKAFLESYYEMEVTLQEDDTWANCTWIPDEDSWWEGRVSLQEFVWDEQQETEYSSGRQPVYVHWVVPKEIAHFMDWIKKALKSHGLPGVAAIYEGVDCDNEHHICLNYNGDYWSSVDWAVNAYNKEHNKKAYVSNAHHIYLPI